MAERFASVSENELCEKCIIKQLLNSVFAWCHELSKPRVCVICLSLRLRQITQTSVLIIHDIMLNPRCYNTSVSYGFQKLKYSLFFVQQKILGGLKLDKTFHGGMDISWNHTSVMCSWQPMPFISKQLAVNIWMVYRRVKVWHCYV